MQTYLEELQSTLARTQAALDDARDWAAHGPTERASAQQIASNLVARHREHAAAKAELDAYLTCLEQGPTTRDARHSHRHATLQFDQPMYGRGEIRCYCPDCLDYDHDGESYVASHTIGYGRTESEALADYHERIESK